MRKVRKSYGKASQYSGGTAVKYDRSIRMNLRKNRSCGSTYTTGYDK
nr:MAG TPA: hypothetical protein [Caudoviricetes sp.]